MFFKKRKTKKYLAQLSRRGVFYYQIGETVVKADPLLAYVRLKEIGLDVMFEDLKGALKGNEAKIKNFAQCVCDAFNVRPIDLNTGIGLTFLDMTRLFTAYVRYLEALKKKVILLRDFAPDLEARHRSIYEDTPEQSDSTGENSLSDSTPTPPQDSPLPDSQPTTEQAEPSTD